MEKFRADETKDITKESYQGSGVVVASAGYMYICHLASVVAGIIVAGIAAYFAHVPINKFVDKMRDYARGSEGFRNKAITGLFGIKHGSHTLNEILGEQTIEHREMLRSLIEHEEMGFFQRIAAKATGKVARGKRAEKIMENGSQEQWSAAFTGGGLGGAAAWVASTVWAWMKGTHESSKGKSQFQRARSEIENQREVNDSLEKINNRLHEKYVAIYTGGKNADASANPGAAIDNIEHQGSLQQSPPEMAVTAI